MQSGEEPGAVSSFPGRGHQEEPESSPPAKRPAMAELFGELFKSQVGVKKSAAQLMREEVSLYRTVDCTELDVDPLV